MPNSRNSASLLLPGLPWCGAFQAQSGIEPGERQARWKTEEGEESSLK